MLKEFRLKKVYLYVLAVIAFFVLLWGAIDTVSAGLSLLACRPPAPPEPPPGAELPLEDTYQKRMFLERIGDSLSRVVIAGGVFIFLSFKLHQLEKEEGGKA